MERYLRSKLYWGILLTSAAVLVLCCRGRDHTPRLPPVEDAFLSYFQSAQGLAGLLLSPQRPNSNSSPENRQEAIAKACEELERLQANVAALSPDEIERMKLAEKDLVAQAARGWNELARRHAKDATFPGVDWPRLEAAFRLSRELNRPTQ
jgi:hypothetical protein